MVFVSVMQYWLYEVITPPKLIQANIMPCKCQCLHSPGGGYPYKNWVGVCGPLPKTLTLFMTKICDFSYPIYDLTKNLIPYL